MSELIKMMATISSVFGSFEPTKCSKGKSDIVSLVKEYRQTELKNEFAAYCQQGDVV